MTEEHRIKVIFDTNIWISYLIGKRLKGLTSLLAEWKVEIILTQQLRTEFLNVTSRKKLKKYFPKWKVKELLELLDIIGTTFEVEDFPELCRDPKDNFLLGLIQKSKADYLVTGDNDLLILHPFEGTQIVTPSEFESKILEERTDR